MPNAVAAPDPLMWAADLLDPPAIDAFAILGYTPTPKQQAFHDATEWDVFYGGAMGGGKTVAILMEGLRACVQHPGIEVWAFRRTRPQLRGSLVKELRSKAALGRPLNATWSETYMDLRFPNGSWFRFLFAENETDAQDYYSQECQLLLLDERQLMNPAIVDNLTLRVRSGNPSIPVLGIRSGGNPGGVGHGTLRSRYVHPMPDRNELSVVAGTDHKRIVPIHPRDGRRLRPRLFIPSKATDNPHINTEYVDETFAETEVDDPVLAQAMRDGNWDLFAGQIFTEWDPEIHIVTPEQMPWTLGGMKRGIGIDYGLTNPFCALWGAVLSDGAIVVYRELYGTDLTPEDQAAKILDAEQVGERDVERPMPTWIDPSTFARQPDSPKSKLPGAAPKGSIAERYRQAGVGVHRANNDRLLGVAEVHRRLRSGPEGPKLFVYSTCFNLIRTLPEIQRDPKRPEDALKKGEDHAYDALRYLLLGLAGKTLEPEDRRPSGPAKTVTAGLRTTGF